MAGIVNESLDLLHNSGFSEKIGDFDEISNLSEPAYAGRPIGASDKIERSQNGHF